MTYIYDVMKPLSGVDHTDPDFSYHDFPQGRMMESYEDLFLEDPRTTGFLLSGDGAKLYLGREGNSQVWIFVVTLVSIPPEKGGYKQNCQATRHSSSYYNIEVP